MLEKLTLESLAQKYDKFSQPRYYIEIEGKMLDSRFTSKDITIGLTSSYEASYCRFTLSNGFKLHQNNKLSIDTELKKIMKLGNKLEAMLGYYGAKKSMVFTGYIDSIYVDYNTEEGILYTIDCLDGKGIMMNSLHSETKKSIKKYSQSVEEILKKYSSVIKIDNNSIDKSDGELSVPIEQHNESDYDFVVRIAKKLNYCFFIVNGQAVFKSMTKINKNIFFQYDINEYITEFKMQHSLKGQPGSIIVRNNNEKNPDKPIESKVDSFQNLSDSGSVKSSALSTLLTTRVSKTLVEHSVSSEAEAKKRAQAELFLLSRQIIQGSIKTPGIPEMQPGRVVKINGFGDGYDKKYYVSNVLHSIKNGNFTTQCRLEANKL